MVFSSDIICGVVYNYGFIKKKEKGVLFIYFLFFFLVKFEIFKIFQKRRSIMPKSI